MTIHQSVGEGGVLELVMDNPKVNALPIRKKSRSFIDDGRSYEAS